MTIKQSPCLNCKNREIGCHSSCNKYINYNLGRKKYLNERRKENLEYYDYKLYKQDVIKRMTK